MGCIYRQPGRGRNYLMKYSVKGRPVVESTGTTDEKKALKALRAKETDRDRGFPVGLGTLRFKDAEAAIAADYANNAYDSTEDMQRRIDLHLKPYFGARTKLTDIRTAEIREYSTHRRAQKAANGTINRELAVLKRMMSLAVEDGRLAFVPHFPMLEEHNVRSGFFEREAFEAARRHLSPVLQDVITVAYLTGWRIDSEILTRQWRHVDLEADELRLDPDETKNGKPRVFPLTAELRDVLVARQAIRDQVTASGQLCPWVFFRLVAKGRRGLSAKHAGHGAIISTPKPIKRFEKAWKAACKKAGCPGRIPHDFRRTAIRNIVRRAVPERVGMELSGHLTRSVFERYNIVSPTDLGDARVKLEDQITTPPAKPVSKTVSKARPARLRVAKS